jgi:hypothetical protein
MMARYFRHADCQKLAQHRGGGIRQQTRERASRRVDGKDTEWMVRTGDAQQQQYRHSRRQERGRANRLRAAPPERNAAKYDIEHQQQYLGCQPVIAKWLLAGGHSQRNGRCKQHRIDNVGKNAQRAS